jgi:ligand-binding SRPBCC domain-containing protein
MANHIFIKQSVVPGTPQQVWDFHAEPGTFALLLPPFERTTILQLPENLEVGATVRTKTYIGPIPIPIHAVITESVRHHYFSDVMMSGPFAYWHHRHEFLPGPDPNSTLYLDTINYRVPLGPLGDLVRPFLVAPRLARVFEYRHQVVLNEMTRRNPI